tara:strand:+ start:645 stop:962 length:318 start_codon:yes stop_codon:yes gene_type:complete
MTDYPSSPGYKEDSTSREAAEAMQPCAARMRAAALNYLESFYPRGFTADEIAFHLNLSILSIRPRISELNTLGMIEKTGERRKNESGNSAHVWRVSKRPTESAAQ